MRIQKLKIHNYRSIRVLDTHREHLDVMLGPNDHRKANILSAIAFVLSLQFDGGTSAR